MSDLLQWSVLLWAGLAILLHLGLILYATSCRASNWWEHRWAQRAERLRWILVWLIGVLFLVALLTSCANQCPCRPKVPPDRIHRLIQTPILDSVVDLGIGIECQWRY
jgi:hypothetical protein